MDVEETLEKAAVAVKDGWRRTKQIAAIKVFKTSTGTDDSAIEAQYDQVLQVERQILGVKQVTEAYLKSLVEMCWSAEQLATKFGDYMSEPGAVGAEPATQAASTWKEVQKGAQRSLEVQFTSKVLQPTASYLGEIEGIKKLHAEHQKKLLDFDYYKRKMAEMTARPPKESSKLTRNADKLRHSEAAYMNVRNELQARLGALLAEKWDFANAPLLQLLDFQQNFYGNLNTAVRPFAAFTYEGALLDAEQRQTARQTLRTEALADVVEPRPLSAFLPQSPAAGPPPAAPAGGYAAPAPPPTAPTASSPYGAYSMPPPAAGGGAAAPPPPAGRPPPPPGPPPGRPPLPPSTPRGEKMRAIGEYAATDARMISFAAGEVMYKEKDEGGWLFGSNSRGEQGYFPSSYVEPLP